MKKKNLRLVLDIAMTVLLPMLMAYSLIGEAFHEIIGTAMLFLFVVHHSPPIAYVVAIDVHEIVVVAVGVVLYTQVAVEYAL